jgi:hypothetical protein
MLNEITYKVEVFSGRFLPGEMKSESHLFTQSEPLKARNEAVTFAITTIGQAIVDQKYDDPDLFRQIPEMVHNVDAFSVDIYFCTADEEALIYGSEVHEVLTGLHVEADYYVKNNLVDSNSLIKILENTKSTHKDPDNEPFAIASPEMRDLPNFEFYTISVLPDDLDSILMNFKEPKEIDFFQDLDEDDENEDYLPGKED